MAIGSFSVGHLSGGPFTWSDGTLFNGYAVINFAVPMNGATAWPTVSLAKQSPGINLPLSVRIPIVEGNPDMSVGVIYNSDITPPNTYYQAWLYEMNGVEVAGPTDAFTVSSDPFTLAFGTITIPSSGAVVPPDDPVTTTAETYYTYFVQGWTAPIDYTLQADGAAFDLTGCTVEVVAYDGDGVLLTLSGPTVVVSATQGTIRYTPAVGDLLAANSPYHVRFKVTNGSSQVYFFPRQREEIWIVAPR